MTRPSALLVFSLFALVASPAFADDAKLVEKLKKMEETLQKQQQEISKLQESKVAMAQRPAAVPEKPIEKPAGQIDKPTGNILFSQAAPGHKPHAVDKPRKPAHAVKRGPLPEHVGEAPGPEKPPEVPILANVGGVLTPYGKITLEPFVQYSRSSVNSFTFQGVEILPAFLVGQINAVRTARDLATAGVSLRAGVTDRLELEVKVPYVGRSDSFTDTIPNTNGATVTRTSEGHDIGDVEVGAHYQVNDGRNDWPFFVANMRFKTNTGTSPYDVPYRNDGTPAELATGSGFMAVEPSLTIIYPSDPAILFANVGYIHSFSRNIGKLIAGNSVGDVEPGDTYMASLGVGLALNDRLSLTFGYEHDYVRPTQTIIGNFEQRSDALQVGSALTGVSFKASDNTSVNLTLAAGVTRDAPDAQITLRVPMMFDLFGN